MAQRRGTVLTGTSVDLSTLLQLQYQLQLEGFGIDPTDLSGEEHVQYIKDNVLALTDELHEMLSEISWKPWASGEWFNREAGLKELVDALHFLMNLLLAFSDANSIKPVEDLGDEVLKLYLGKRQLNFERQAAGYDGRTGKCPKCQRALDDDGVRHDIVLGYPKTVAYCAGCGQRVPDFDSAVMFGDH